MWRSRVSRRSMVWHQFGPTKDHYIDCVLWFGSTFCIYKSHQRPSDQRSPCVANLAWAPQTIMSCEMSWCHGETIRHWTLPGDRRHLFDLAFQVRLPESETKTHWPRATLACQVVFKACWLSDFAMMSMDGTVSFKDFTTIWLKTWIWRIQRLRCQGRWYRQQKLESLRIF